MAFIPTSFKCPPSCSPYLTNINLFIILRCGEGGTRTHEPLSGHGFPSRSNGHYRTSPRQLYLGKKKLLKLSKLFEMFAITPLQFTRYGWIFIKLNTIKPIIIAHFASLKTRPQITSLRIFFKIVRVFSETSKFLSIKFFSSSSMRLH